MRRKNLVKGLGCLIVGATVLVSNLVLVQAEDGTGSEVNTTETSDPVDIYTMDCVVPVKVGDTLTPEAVTRACNEGRADDHKYEFTYDDFPETVYTTEGAYEEVFYGLLGIRKIKFQVKVNVLPLEPEIKWTDRVMINLKVGERLTPEALNEVCSVNYDFYCYNLPETVYNKAGVYKEKFYAVINHEQVVEFEATVVVVNNRELTFVDKNGNQRSATVKLVPLTPYTDDNDYQYIENSYISYDENTGKVCVDASFLGERNENGYYYDKTQNKMYEISTIEMDVGGHQFDFYSDPYDVCSCERDNDSGEELGRYYCDLSNNDELSDGGSEVQFIFKAKETALTATARVIVNEWVWNWYDVGVLKSCLSLKINDAVYPLSKTDTCDVALNYGDKVKVLAGETKEVWSGTVKADGTNLSLESEMPESEDNLCNLEYDSATKSLNLWIHLDRTFMGGGIGLRSYSGGFKYDFKAKTSSGRALSNISLIDDTLDGVEEFFGYKSGNTYTWGTNNTFECKSWTDGYGPLGVITYRTNKEGIADMLMPIHPDSSWIDSFGKDYRFDPSCNLHAYLQETGWIYEDKLTSFGGSVPLEATKSGPYFGDSYLLATGSFGKDKVVLKDLEGKQIATVEMGIDSVNTLIKVKDDIYLAGCDIVDNHDFSDIVPKVDVKMAEGMDNWKVDVKYEKATSTFHIVATKDDAGETLPAVKNVQLSKSNMTYNGKAQTPTVKVVDSEGSIILPENYAVSYKNNKNVGQATVTVTLKGNYSGTLTANFTIKPQSTKISSVTAKKKGFALKWNKQTSQTDGYQIQYAANKKFTSAKTVLVNKNKTVAKTVSNLNAKKTYYVRVRTYKTVKVNGKNTKIYSGWSIAKKVVTK